MTFSSLEALRRFIKEELDRNMRWSAGIAPQGIGSTAANKQPTLGDSEHEEEQEEQTKN